MTVTAVFACLAIGLLLGPNGLDVMSTPVLLLVDPVVAMALALVGVFVGASAVAGGDRFDVSLVLIVLGGIVAAALREPTSAGALLLLAATGVALVVACAGWLLVREADSEREQQVFAAGALLLLGGSAAFLSLSSAFAGLLAGLLWHSADGPARQRLLRNAEQFKHPLLVLLLVVAGASVAISIEGALIAAAIVAIQAVTRHDGRALPAALVAAAVALDVVRGWPR